MTDQKKKGDYPKSKMYLLDTDILIEILRGNIRAKNKVNELIKYGICTSSLNFYELIFGMLSFGKSKEKMKTLYDKIKSLEILPLTMLESSLSAKIALDLKEQGKWPGLIDIFIASIAISNNRFLVTNNKKHYENIKDLKIVSW